MKKNVRRLIVILLALAMLFSILLPALSILASASSSSGSDEVTEEEIDALESELAEAQRRRIAAQQELNAIRGDLSRAQQAVDLAQQQLLLTEQSIDTTKHLIQSLGIQIQQTKADIVAKEGEIAQTQEDLKQTQNRLDNITLRIDTAQRRLAELVQQEKDQTQAYYDHVRWLEETGPMTYIAILLQSGSFSELLDQTMVIGNAMNYTNDILDRLEDTQMEMSITEANLEEDKEEQVEVQAQQEEQLATEQQQKQDLEAQQKQLETDTANQQQYQKDLEAQRLQYIADRDEAQKLLEEIAATESAYAQEAAALAAEEANIQQALTTAEQKYQEQLAMLQNTGDWYWPLPGKYSLSSLFGGRYLFGYWDSHTGTDIPAPAGTEIHAAQGGVVSYVSSNYYSSYGWYCMISHGNGYVTLYAHQRVKPIVTEGQVVNKGDVIGYVGTTGNSTGNHLHFELRLNGTRADILQLFPNTTFYMNGVSWKGNQYPAGLSN